MEIFDYLVTGSLLMIVSAIFYLPVYFILRRKMIPILKQLSWALLGGVIGCMLMRLLLDYSLLNMNLKVKSLK